jgi:hypothetical protein
LKTLGLLIATVLIAYVSGAWVTIQWIDGKTIPSIDSTRTSINLAYDFYRIIPVHDKERNITRVLKFAHLIAMAESNDKALELITTDLARSYWILKELSETPEKIPDTEALNELSVHLMVVANRMIALGIAGNERFNQLEQEIDHLAELINKDTFATPEIQAVALREKELKRSMLTGTGFTENQSQHLSDDIKMANILYEGLGMCIGGNQLGALALDSSLNHFSKNRIQFIYQVSRNIDFPLISIAGKYQHSPCSTAISRAIPILTWQKIAPESLPGR